MARIRADYVFGTTDAALTVTDTTLSSPALSRLPVVASPDIAAVTLHDSATGAYEIVHVTAHTAAAASVTILRGREGSSSQEWASGATWAHGPTKVDMPSDPTVTAGRGDNLGASLNKVGVVLTVGDAGAFDEQMVESPSILRDPKSGRYVMTYTGYDATSRGRAGYAYSDDLHAWTKAGVLLPHSGTPSAPDENGATGPVLYWDAANGRYVLYYIGLTSVGYEAGTKTICYATADDLAGPWTRHGAVISPSGTGWRQKAVWHVSVVERAGQWFCFFNATGSDDKERIGYATAPNITGPWTVDDANSPVLDVVATSWESNFVGDPSVRRVGDLWVMAYYGFDGASAADGLAVTSDADFPLGWQRHPANPILSPSETYDAKYAHKPFVFVDGGRVFHFFTSVAADDSRQIALATSGSSVVDLSSAPTVTGKVSDGTALQSLLDSLATLGLSVDLDSIATVSDSFNRADGALGAADTGQTWVSSGGAGWAVASNEAKWTGGGDGAALVDSGLSDNYAIEFTLREVNGGYPIAIAARGTDAATYTKIHRDNVGSLSWVLSGTPAAGSPAPVAGDVIRVEVAGGTVTLKRNGTAEATWTGVTAYATGTFQGIVGSGGLVARLDDFTVTAI